MSPAQCHIVTSWSMQLTHSELGRIADHGPAFRAQNSAVFLLYEALSFSNPMSAQYVCLNWVAENATSTSRILQNKVQPSFMDCTWTVYASHSCGSCG